MHILIVSNSKIPALKYGGTERVIYDLGQALVKFGHKVTFLVAEGSHCSFAPVKIFNSEISLQSQIPDDVDVVHLNHQPSEDIRKPYIVTMHGNANDINLQFDQNTVFVSSNHAERFGSNVFVHNGLNWKNYGKLDLTSKQKYFHFLGKAAWRIKNIKGAIQVCQNSNERLKVLGGYRFNIKMGLRLTFDPRISFEGMVDDARKQQLLPYSKGLIFPVLWHEPFGLAITESLYFGVPVFGTPYGSLPELVTKEVGFLSNSASELSKAIKESSKYDRKVCSDYASDLFNADVMAKKYLSFYELVLNGNVLNQAKPQLKCAQTEKFLPWLP